MDKFIRLSGRKQALPPAVQFKSDVQLILVDAREWKGLVVRFTLLRYARAAMTGTGSYENDTGVSP
jgi:hypothetical protein